MPGFLKRFSQRGTGLGRVEAFSDGVFAIIVTLLILEIKVPDLHDVKSAPELCGKLAALCPKLLSWLISFMIVCKFWVNHSFILSLAKHSTYTLVWLNCIFLLCQSFIPFPSALMGEYITNPLAVSFFGVVFAVNTIVYIIMHRYINKYLLKDEYKDIQEKNIIMRSAIGPFCYLAGALLAWVSIPASLVAYFLTPLLFVTPVHKDLPVRYPVD